MDLFNLHRFNIKRLAPLLSLIRKKFDKNSFLECLHGAMVPKRSS